MSIRRNEWQTQWQIEFGSYNTRLHAESPHEGMESTHNTVDFSILHAPSIFSSTNHRGCCILQDMEVLVLPGIKIPFITETDKGARLPAARRCPIVQVSTWNSNQSIITWIATKNCLCSFDGTSRVAQEKITHCIYLGSINLQKSRVLEMCAIHWMHIHFQCFFLEVRLYGYSHFFGGHEWVVTEETLHLWGSDFFFRCGGNFPRFAFFWDVF